MKEKKYLAMRKLKAFGYRLLFYVFRIFPINKNLISVCTFEGKGGFCCNPKYIVRDLHKRNSCYKFVWFVDDMTKKFPSYIKKVSNTAWNRAYWLSISKIWIDNYRKPLGTAKRKGQYYLNTNHYTFGIKCVGLWRKKGFSKIAYMVSKNDSDMIDDLIIDSKFCKMIYPKGYLYNGPYLKTGAPRCDILHGNRSKYRKWFREKHGIPQDAKVVMFAPTFRENAVAGKRNVYSQDWSLNFEALLENMELKFGGTWYLCLRVHPQLTPTYKKQEHHKLRNRLIDESLADDMYEILAGMDAYITDYSSASFEAGFTEMPVFLYADDIETYTAERGDLFWNMNGNDPNNAELNRKVMKEKITLPFSIATNNRELAQNIINFDEENYKKNLKEFYSRMDLVFDGNASRRVADKIEKMMN